MNEIRLKSAPEKNVEFKNVINGNRMFVAVQFISCLSAWLVAYR